MVSRRLQGLGHHQAAMCVQVRSLRNPGKVLFEAPVQVMGSSLSVGPKQPLPGGITATPETFTLSRWAERRHAIQGMHALHCVVTLAAHPEQCCVRPTQLLVPRFPLRSLVDEADAATARLLAGKTYTRPKIWEVEENANRLQGIGSTDK